MRELATLWTQLQPYGADLTNHLTNHTPMVVEVLCRWGFERQAAEWFEQERPRLTPRPPHIAPICEPFELALGDPARYSDWSSYFQSQIDALGWQAVVQRWVAKLSPGFATAATHGVIRVAHAVNGLTAQPGPAAERELADAFASWCYAYEELPYRDSSAELEHLSDLVAAAPLVQPEHHSPKGSITDALGHLTEYPEYIDLFGAWQSGAPTQSLIPQAAAIFAQVFHQATHDALSAIVFTHALTSLAATDTLLPLLKQTEGVALLQHAVHSALGLYAVYAPERFNPAAETSSQHTSPDTLKQQAIAHGDEHVIKLTDACLKFHDTLPEPIFLSVPGKAAQYLPVRQ